MSATKRLACALLLCAPLLTAAPGAQTLFALFRVDDGHRQLGTVERSTGMVNLLGSADSIANEPISTASGLAAYNHADQLIYFVGRMESDGVDRIFSVSTVTGAATASPALSTGSITTICGLHYDAPDGPLLGVLRSDREVVTIDPATGTVTGNEFTQALLSTHHGVITADSRRDKGYFPASTVNNTGAARTPGLWEFDFGGTGTRHGLTGVNANAIVGLEFDPDETINGRLYTLIDVGAGRRLARITDTPSFATIEFLGPGPLFGGMQLDTIQGVTTLDAPRNRFHFVARSGGVWYLVTARTNSGNGVMTPLLNLNGATVDALIYATGARCFFRNGSGVNRTGFTCVTPPTLGSNWRSQVATGGNTAATFVMISTAGPATIPIPLVGEVLFALLPLPWVISGNGQHSVPIPQNNALVGTICYTQAFRVDLLLGFIPKIKLMNAQDLLLNH